MVSFVAKDAMRLDLLLVKEGGGRSRAEAQRLIDAGLVRLCGRVVKKASATVRTGDHVEYEELPPSPSETVIGVEDLHLPILYEDSVCLVINKPAGLSVAPGAGRKPGTPTVLHGIAHLFSERHIPFSHDRVLVHRLDKETTGCLLVAKNPDAHSLLQQQFMSRQVRKVYLALVAGIPSPREAIIDAPVGRNIHRKTTMSIIGTRKPREAQTLYRVIGSHGDVALLQCEPRTGRTHQIRVHCAAIGHPILGDRQYTSGKAQKFRHAYEIPSLCLHAWRLTFTSPADQREHEVVAPPPPAFREVMRKVGMDSALPLPLGED